MAGPNIGYATISIIPSARGFRSHLNGEIGGDIDAAGKESGGRFGKAFSKVAAGTVAASAAAIGVGIKGLIDFTGFEQQMNEVFTLLPGISGDAMDSMTEQVKNFSKEFGVLPDQVVPALYQSLSAGVPQGNVFEFLETAQKAAKGGVTDLTTAVDGISSVVNAYGSEVIDATKTSDLMFTAVRLGKTNFEELSASLSNVTPIASGLGVGFEDVTAGLAAMTAQGTPTAQATTQMRALFVELSKAGGETAKVFEDAAGKSFQEFIAQGGNTADALDIMKKAADESGVQIQDLFGSVEAGSAALSLAGSDAFVGNLDEMSSAAGATEAAFDQMNKGLGPIFDRIKANLAVFFIDIGQRLAPVVEKALGALGDVFGKVMPQISLFWNALRTGFTEDEGTPIEAIALTIRGYLIPAFENVSTFVTGTLIPAFKEFGSFIVDTVVPAIVDLAKWIKNNEPILAGLAAVVGVYLVASFTAWAIAAGTAALATAAAAAPFIAIGAAIAATVAALVWAYQNWEVFRTVVDAVAQFLTDTVWPAIQAGVTWLADELVPAIADVVGWIIDKLIPVFEAQARIITERVIPAVSAMVSFFLDRVVPAIGAVISWFGEMGTKIGELATTVNDKVWAILGFFAGLAGGIADIAESIWSPLADTFEGVVNGIIDAWNSIDFGIHVSIPDWVPKVGGKGFHVDDIFPDIPRLHGGGKLQTAPGESEGLAILLNTERVLSPAETRDYEAGRSMSATPLIGGDYVVQVLQGDDSVESARRELDRIRYLAAAT